MGLRYIAYRSGTAPTLDGRNPHCQGPLPARDDVDEVRSPAFETVRAGQ